MPSFMSVRRPELEGLRGVTILLVSRWHRFGYIEAEPCDVDVAIVAAPNAGPLIEAQLPSADC